METVFIALRVLVVLAVIVLVLWYVQRRVTKGRGASRRTNAVNVVGRQGIGPKASVVVVDVDGNRFVLGVTERQVSVLHTGERPHDADVRPLRPVRKTFAKETPGCGGVRARGDGHRQLHQLHQQHQQGQQYRLQAGCRLPHGAGTRLALRRGTQRLDPVPGYMAAGEFGGAAQEVTAAADARALRPRPVPGEAVRRASRLRASSSRCCSSR